MTYTLLVLLLIGVIHVKGQGCLDCSTNLATCTQNAIAGGIAGPGYLAAICTCNVNYLSCLQSSSSDSLCSSLLNSFAATCPTSKLTCATLNCPSTLDPCTQCQVDFSTCSANGVGTNPCSCISPWLGCLSRNSCPSTDILCGSYKGLCPSAPCTAAAGGCGQCVGSFSTCVNSNPMDTCPCLDSLRTCVHTCTGAIAGTASDYDITCPIYQAQCPSIECNSSVAATGCTKCAVDASVCAINSLKNGASGVCSCLSSLYSCLSGSTCGLTPFTGMCGVYSGVCSNVPCSTGRTQLPSQVVSLINHYRDYVKTYLEDILNGTITFGESVVKGNTQVINFVADIPEGSALEEYFMKFKTYFANYFNIPTSLIEVTYGDTTVKRTAQSAQVTIHPANSGSTTTTSMGAIIIAVMLWVFFSRSV